MPEDITMCPGHNCPIQQNCYRFTAQILGRQDFFVEAPYSFSDNYCGYFISNRPDENKIRMKAYRIWQLMGYPDGQALDHWLQAEKKLIE